MALTQSKTLENLRSEIARDQRASAKRCLDDLLARHAPDLDQQNRASQRAVKLVEAIREEGKPGLMEVFLAEYGLSTEEGVALMCLAEALLRVPDPDTIDALIEDKIAPSSWGSHLGQSSSGLVNASTWALMLTGKVLREDGQGIAAILKGSIKRVGEPVIRAAVQRAMRELGHQFVLGRDIEEAISRGTKQEARGFTFSYDMLGEAAMTRSDAEAYFEAYSTAIASIAKRCIHGDIRRNPGISIKLSALHPRYEETQRDRVMAELVPATLKLAQQAAKAGMGLNIDAEEADRLDLSLDVIEAVLRDPTLAGWDGFGVVVQAYGKRASKVISWIHELADELDRKIMVRLVKGAYWDTEIKRAQVEGLPDYPVYTRKTETDVSYICCAHQLLQLTDRIYPQFATHNAQTVASILEMGSDPGLYEFQRLQGMGEALHRRVHDQKKTGCRIYAPVGAHRDLLAYLVRRLLENGANSSFVNQIVDESVPAQQVAKDPFETLSSRSKQSEIQRPSAIYGARKNSRGWDIHDQIDLQEIDAAVAPFQDKTWSVGPLVVPKISDGEEHIVNNPARPSERVGVVHFATAEDTDKTIEAAKIWDETAQNREEVLLQAADLYEENFGEFFALLQREAGKTRADCIAELREAVDFLRYYAAEGVRLDGPKRGIFACISPWNFPLAIFTGQIAAALAAGNGVIAKPAESTSIIAVRAVELLHQAGVPEDVLQLVPGHGHEVGSALSSNPAIAGVCFTGSTATAQRINRNMADKLDPLAPLIAETGGLNAMIVDSTALPQQAIRDIVVSAFQSAGQRCSALRVLYVQEDIAGPFLKMLYGAMDELHMGDPAMLSSDIGPLIDEKAQDAIRDCVATANTEGRVLKTLEAPQQGYFLSPTVVQVAGIEELDHEVFGPILHVATYKSKNLGKVVAAINATGYGLTFGMHSRIDDRVEQVVGHIHAGNLYINRNQIGAIVGSQPFGGEGLSGTGPKAGGPNYVARFLRPDHAAQVEAKTGPESALTVQHRLDNATLPKGYVATSTDMPGPTGESNRLTEYPRGCVLCLGPGQDLAARQSERAKAAGCAAVEAPGLQATYVTQLTGFDLVALEDSKDIRAVRQALAARDGAILSIATLADLEARCRLERHVCIDTTAAGGNTALLSENA